MTTYLGMGLLGNMCNCIVFTQPAHRRTPCSLYLLAMSIFASLYLIWSNFPFLYQLEHNDPQTQSVVYCKMRLYGSHVLGQCVRYLIVCACADRFYVTRANPRIRSLSSVHMASKFILIVVTTWVVTGSHLLIFLDLRTGVCGLFGSYKLFYSIYATILIAIVPQMLMSIFSFLTIRSLHQLHGAQTLLRQKDRDLMRMLIVELIINIFTSVPYATNLIYGAGTLSVVNKSAERLEVESFLNFLSNFFINMLSATPFYLFITSSRSFRQEFFQILKRWWYKYILRRTQVAPSH
ncbi:unnamed protein product [Adineta steineri]|uniref:G-protein coupled receptors family 1 profile domain-containing protein n=1 Tax=Adineta steineri TaxID=433720 RepID=A0A814MAB7_9BILA|nr:unnamed protein product [Adineta steineri]CAF1283772.1 unnamed protein product [Adineta steineri]